MLDRDYDAHVASLVPFYQEDERAVYRVDRRTGTPWVLRLFSLSRPLDRVRGDAAILAYIERHGLPGERLVTATAGATAADWEGRGVLVTQFIPGSRPDRSPVTLRRLGELVGRLHALPPVSADDPFLSRRAGALPKEDLAFGRSCLARVADRVPPERRDEYDTIWATLAATHDCEDLPHTLIHNDCHLANALCAAGGDVVFFDWEGAGQGPTIAALGLLLFSCAIQAPDEPAVPTDPARVDAVIDGYRRWHVPTPAELERLSDAVRVRPAVIAARSLAQGIEREQSADRTGWWARYGEADAVAARARQILERHR